MVERAFKIKHGRLGQIAAVVVAVCVLGPMLAVVLRAGGAIWFGPLEWAAIRFTIFQSVLSAGISVVLAIPVARALARRIFPGRGMLITLLGAPFILPVIVAILGLLAVFGRHGIVSTFLGWFGLPPVQIYGLHGVVLAHVFFNLPLATRMILQGWQGIDAERFRLAASLGMGPSHIARMLEFPMLRAVVPGALMVVFAICLTSFAVALTLGGGPRATTVELAIYQAFRYDFNLGKAAILALFQMGIAGGAAVLALWFSAPLGTGAGLDRAVQRWDASSVWLRAQDTVLLGLVSLFLLGPLCMILLNGIMGLGTLPGSIFRAALVSLVVALVSCGMTVFLAFSMAAARRGWVDVVGLLGIAVSPLVLGTGLFLVINPWADPAVMALPVTAVVNALMALPFALRILGPELRAVERDYGRLADSLGMHGWARVQFLLWPRLRRPLGFSAGLAAALSMGDLGVVALFSDPEWPTLPLKMFQLMGAYRMESAAGAGVVLLGLSLALFWIFDRGGRVDVDV